MVPYMKLVSHKSHMQQFCLNFLLFYYYIVVLAGVILLLIQQCCFLIFPDELHPGPHPACPRGLSPDPRRFPVH